MIELKVVCDCGQKYKFDVEPVNGQMPFTVACPICNRDGTGKANALLQQMAVFRPIEPALAPVPPPPIAAPVASTPPPIASLARQAPVAAAEHSAKKPNFALGLVGALVGAAIGSVLYFVIYKFTGPIPFLRYVLALGVGGLAGVLANVLGKREGSKELGGLAAVFTIVGILGAQYFLTLQRWHANDTLNTINQSVEDGGYAESVKQAKEIIKEISTGSDTEIRNYLAKASSEDGDKIDPSSVLNDQVKQFREELLPGYRDLATGKITKQDYWKKNGFDPQDAQKVLDTEDKAESGLAVIVAVLKAGIFSMIAGAALAFKLSANA